MGRSRFGVVAAFSALLSLDCGGDPEPDPMSEMYDVLSAIGRAECRQWFKCCTPRELALHQNLFTSEAECVNATYPPGAFGASLARGRIAFNVDRARACLAAIESATCATPDATISSGLCDAIDGLVPAGQACDQHYECIEGSCDRDEVSGEEICVGPAANGAACTLGTECASRVCSAEKRCIDPLVDGERCTYDGECASRECSCDILTPSQRGCPGAIGVCTTGVETGCSLD